MNPVVSPRPVTGAALVFGSCVSLSVLGAAVAAQLFDELGAWGVTALRLGIAAIVMVLVVRPVIRHWRRGQWRERSCSCSASPWPG
ncbi:hypothetical protein OED01_02935 [Microbacterium sp. M28]|uniref:hypothetical protein n=1 Tax=Microbacterium sp. M28 TaxID=2962064 RepID=UPI0021F44B7F|nr:hypothetical protein [Microbacterium sp. M28]UYO97690.1 hypothetical protein OED01_02935 [Microbacterium sp. M28]